MRVARAQLLAKNRRLRILAPQAQNSSSSDVRVVNVPSQQSAEIIRIFASAATTSLVNQELDPVYIFKQW